MKPKLSDTSEQRRLAAQQTGKENWRLWGPYLSERAWGTVREDYSPDGNAWDYFDFEQSHMRTYRWNEDGMGGICDIEQRLCFALALWNGQDRILKERLFGLNTNEGNHGEDVKEYFFYPDAVPSHSYLTYRYKYPQTAFPYQQLREENARRTRQAPPYSLLDTGIFDQNRYWDVSVTYAKQHPTCILIRMTVSNRGPETAMLHLLPTLWFRNTWAWEDEAVNRPKLTFFKPQKAAWAVKVEHEVLDGYRLYGRNPAECLFTENESHLQALYGVSNVTPFVKDAFHRKIIHGDDAAVNSAREGTKFAARHLIECDSQETVVIDMVLSSDPLSTPFDGFEAVLAGRKAETDDYYRALLPDATPEDALIFRQALSGMIWTQQFFHYDVARWLEGDQVPPPEERKTGRNHQWKHFKAAEVISMPDNWEYPWFAAWDLAFQCMALALVDIPFAKQQLELLLDYRHLHPNGQIPAYEWEFKDVNPPVHAAAALEVFRFEKKQTGQGDLPFLRRMFNKLTMNYVWWLNRKDSDGQNVFEGGFMGLDNISVYDRSKPLPQGFSLKQADATGWMAMFSLNMTAIALELSMDGSEYEDMAIQCYEQFLSIASAIAGHAASKLSLWDRTAGFFKDLMIMPDGCYHRIDVYSYVGIIPLFACEIVSAELLENVPRFRDMLDDHMGGLFNGQPICECPYHTNDRGERLLSLVDHTMLPRILTRLLDDNEFLSLYGIRSLSRKHAENRELGNLPGLGTTLIEYEPGESTTNLFGGNSNWRGPVWMPINYMLLRTLNQFYQYLGPNFQVVVPWIEDRTLNLQEVQDIIINRLINIFRRDEHGRIPAYPENSPFQNDPHWRDMYLFHEYFHGENGQGLGASHQTGWTGLVANLMMQHYERKATGPNHRKATIWPGA
jgi:hypothetical protein